MGLAMIKAKGSRGGRPFVLFGLSAKNVERLKAGDPAHIWAEEMALPFDVVIMYGETEQAMIDQVSRTCGGAPTVERTTKQ
jgi:hypothetical protein